VIARPDRRRGLDRVPQTGRRFLRRVDRLGRRVGRELMKLVGRRTAFEDLVDQVGFLSPEGADDFAFELMDLKRYRTARDQHAGQIE
jgi:hypothetical protein